MKKVSVYRSLFLIVFCTAFINKGLTYTGNYFSIGMNTAFQMGWLFYEKGDQLGYDRSHLRPEVPIELDLGYTTGLWEFHLIGGIGFFYDNEIISSTDRVHNRYRYALNGESGYAMRTHHAILKVGRSVASNERGRIIPGVGVGTFGINTKFPGSESFSPMILRRFEIRFEREGKDNHWLYHLSPLYDFYTIDSKDFTRQGEQIELHGLGVSFGLIYKIGDEKN